MKSLHFHAYIILFLSNFLLSHQSHEASSPLLLYESKFPTFQFPSEKAKNDSIKQGRYDQSKNIILDADYHARTNRYFVTTPPFSPYGVPATFSVLNLTTGLLKPFPSFPTYVNSSSISCNSLFAVFRTYIDDCGRLWVMDSGRNESVSPNYLHCPPKLIIYDLNNNDREILRYVFPYGVYTERSMFINVIVESHNADCSGSYAYIADVLDYALIVFDYANRNSWRIEHKYFYPFPTHMTVTVNHSVVFSDSEEGIYGVTLGPKTEKNRKLYYHSYASARESWAPISVLKNQSIANYPPVTRKEYHLSPGQRRNQSAAEVMTESGILIYSLVATNQLVCWNSRTPFTLENQHVIKTDEKRFQFISGLKLYNNKLIITSCRLTSFFSGLAGSQPDANYRVMVVNDVNRWLQDTPCARATSTNPSKCNSYQYHY